MPEQRERRLEVRGRRLAADRGGGRRWPPRARRGTRRRPAPSPSAVFQYRLRCMPTSAAPSISRRKIAFIAGVGELVARAAEHDHVGGSRGRRRLRRPRGPRPRRRRSGRTRERPDGWSAGTPRSPTPPSRSRPAATSNPAAPQRRGQVAPRMGRRVRDEPERDVRASRSHAIASTDPGIGSHDTASTPSMSSSTPSTSATQSGSLPRRRA